MAYRIPIPCRASIGQNGCVITHRKPTSNSGRNANDSESPAGSDPSLAARQEKLNRRKRGRQLLHALYENGDYRQLQRYAAGRLLQLGLNSEAAADSVHDAVLAVLIGLDGGRNGRHARPHDLQDLPSFCAFLKRTIKSIVTSAGRHHRCVPIIPIDDGGDEGKIQLGFATSQRPDEDVEFLDLRDELFRRLRKRCPTQARRMAKAWQREFMWSDAIPLRGAHRQYRAQLREVARQILAEIEPTLKPTR